MEPILKSFMLLKLKSDLAINEAMKNAVLANIHNFSSKTMLAVYTAAITEITKQIEILTNL